MPPKKLPPHTSLQKPQTPTPQQKQQAQSAPKPNANNASSTPTSKPAIPEHEVKQSSSVSAQLALEAAKKAYELRQAAYAAGDPHAREEILAKAINKEIEAESFGKAAKYTRSGAFQGLAAGAGLGIQPGVTLGKLTGALVGGVVSSAGALLGGGIGSAYGAVSGPFWDLGQMASHAKSEEGAAEDGVGGAADEGSEPRRIGGEAGRRRRSKSGGLPAMGQGFDKLYPEYGIDAFNAFSAFIKDHDSVKSEPAIKSTSKASGAFKASTCSSRNTWSDAQVTIPIKWKWKCAEEEAEEARDQIDKNHFTVQPIRHSKKATQIRDAIENPDSKRMN
ncbi:uncharacterized protein Z519_10841 [Cladophialophora bantiana CBS 173.52]|uniref:Uncharacterized protein n=1 Tax=Cladophialophora bantiana (strain ATCC 10958 / CBS 173.52 / CDC B-1940 / NIH 8579) TaxID=1442370 RepID=A0A0D2HW35_CLAB1|nr:uncharacterized protein Z519_10841 [Cladophialophora bantiana CBS 173.52]KIW88794.1 hypothetical protein Z519_10841 [Cladophialophora bantiana CBS 173.52]